MKAEISLVTRSEEKPYWVVVDVITAGTATRETIELVVKKGGEEFGVQTASIVTLDDLIAMSWDKGDEGDRKRLEKYRRRCLASD